MLSEEHRFVATFLPSRVVFGLGSVEDLAQEVRRLDASRVLVLCTPEQRDLAQRCANLLGDLACGVFDGAAMHVPAAIVERAAEAARAAKSDLVLAAGGGSTIGLAKALAVLHGLRFIALPTTYAGSEMTPIWAVTDHDSKRVGRDTAVLPSTVVYDPGLLLSLPADVTGPSGMNAIAHAVEALYAVDGNPVTELLAEESIRAMSVALARAVVAPDDVEARASTLRAAWLAGTVLGTTTMGLHHQLCHVMGGRFGLPHAPMHAALLSHAVAFNAAEAPRAMERAARALGEADVSRVAASLHGLLLRTCPVHSLRALGLRELDLSVIADLALAKPYSNPRPVSRAGLMALLHNAWEGTAPVAHPS